MFHRIDVFVEQGKGLLTGGVGFPLMKVDVSASTHPLGDSHSTIVGVDTNQVANQKSAVFGLPFCGWKLKVATLNTKNPRVPHQLAFRSSQAGKNPLQTVHWSRRCGAVVELEKVAGEPLDVLVNDQLVARGEAVVINDKFGVRLTDVVDRHDRVQGLS